MPKRREENTPRADTTAHLSRNSLLGIDVISSSFHISKLNAPADDAAP
jgi:hypothetical protein